jgi:hypothetical protein
MTLHGREDQLAIAQESLDRIESQLAVQHVDNHVDGEPANGL